MAELGSSPEVMSVEESELEDSPSSAAWEAPIPPGSEQPVPSGVGLAVPENLSVSRPPVLPPSSPAIETLRWLCMAFDGLMVAILLWFALAVPLHMQEVPEQSARMIVPMSLGTALFAGALGYVALALYRRKPWAWWPQLGLMFLLAVPVISVTTGLLGS